MKTSTNRRKVGLPQVIGLFVNTGEARGGYEAPFDHAESRAILRRIREWQECHNSISHNHDFGEHGEADK